MKGIQRYLYVLAVVCFVNACTPKMSQDMSADSTNPPATTESDWRSRAPEPAPAPEFKLGDYQEFDLENGLKVIIVENHKLPVVSYQLFVDRGPTVESEKAGVSSITGQMLKTGTKSMSKAEIDEKLDFLAATLQTNSSGFYASSLKKHSSELLEIATDILYNPSFPEEEFERIIQTTKSGLAFQKSDPNSISSNVGNAVLYGKEHAYGEFTTEESVDAITLQDVRDFYENYYFPNRTYLIIVGDISADEAKAQAEEYFSAWQPKPGFEPMTPDNVSRPAGNSVSFVNRDGAVQSVLTVAQTADYKPNSPDRIAASVMNTILGGYFGSRLNKNIREDKGYTYGIYSNLSPDRHIGEFSISASVRNEVTDSTLTEILAEIKRLQTEPVDAEELQLVKNVVTGQFARGLESPQTIAQYALNIARYDLPKDYYKTYLERLEKLTPADIQAAAKKYLDPAQLHILVVGNEADVAEKLLRFDSDNTIDFYDAKANKLDKAAMEAEIGSVDAQTVIEKYLKALGGRSAIQNVKSYLLTTKASTPMGDVITTMKGKDNTKVHMKVEASGMVVQEITFNGMKAKVGGVQGNQVITDPKEFDRFKEMAKFAKELDYFKSSNYKISFAGQDKIDDETVYKILIVQADGTNTTEFYSVESGLKVQEITNVEANGQQFSTTQKYSKYERVDGILLPMQMTLSGGGMPFEMVTEVQEVKINVDIPEEEFVIN